MRRRLGILFLLLVIATVGAFSGWYYWTHRYDKLIIEAARKHSLDPALVKAIIYEESYFSPRAHSSQNAVGLMQVTPVVAQEWMEAAHSQTPSKTISPLYYLVSRPSEPRLEEALGEPAVSLHIGCWYFQSLLNRYRDERDPVAVALAAYNAGPANVERWASNADRSNLSREDFINQIEFPATRSYVQKIIERYDSYKRNHDLQSER